MAELSFESYFQELHGIPPYRWQNRLASRVVRDGWWPDLIDLPTGAGKTAVVDIALFALASRPDVFPRRVVFVVDRRLIVDQVAARAGAIRDRMLAARPGSTLAAVARRLRSLAADPDEPGVVPVQVASLRGGTKRTTEWAARPDQPWVIASTVDQVGSRLLLRGYGVSRPMRPVHAGVFARDCLIVLDEVHLSEPFAETLSEISSYQDAGTVELPRRWQVVEMSATPRSGDQQVFTLDPGEPDPEEEAELFRRLRSNKRARLHVAKGKTKQPALAMVDEVPRLLEGMTGTVAVVVNRVDTARQVADKLRTVLDGQIGVSLLTGRMRPLERDRILEDIQPLVDPSRPAGVAELRHVVVATQAIEVGADYSFDAMITQCASASSLRQRFGRLDRAGANSAAGRPATAVIVGIPRELKSGADPDPVYGEALRRTWEAMERHLGFEEELDISPMSPVLGGLGPACEREPKHAPLLLPSHLNALVQTSQELNAEPSIAPFLHGPGDHDLDVRICWRGEVAGLGENLESLEADTAVALGRLRQCPPRSSEMASIPIGAVRSWLTRAPAPQVSDVEGADSEDYRGRGSHSRRVFRWAGDSSAFVPPNEVRVGDVLVVESGQGGLWNGNWAPEVSDTVSDLGDLAQDDFGINRTLRLLPAVVGSISPVLPSVPRVDPTDDDPESTDGELALEWLHAALEASAADESDLTPPWYHSLLVGFRDALENGGSVRVSRLPSTAQSTERYLILTGLQERTSNVGDSLMGLTTDLDGSDQLNSMTGSAVTLEEHLRGVGSIAGLFATRLGLAEELVSDFELAGELHDLGKADPRFQLWLHGGDRIGHATSPALLAKSVEGSRGRGPTQSSCGYPRGGRHELMSVALALSDDSLLDRAHDRELVLHLVATHHGFGRPMARSVVDDYPVEVSVEHNGHRMACRSDEGLRGEGSESLNRFWRLVDRYGWFGLTWLEMVFRLADHRRSALETARTMAEKTTGKGVY